MTLDSQCHTSTAAGVQMYDGAAPASGMMLGGLDRAHLSQPVGGTVTAAWFSNLPLTVGSHVMSLQVDSNNGIVEANEANNTLTKTLTCQLPPPDLVAVSISLTSQCQVIITLMNVGTAPLPDAAFAFSDASTVQMYRDGATFSSIRLGALDLTRQLQPVGGTITYNWFPNLKRLLRHRASAAYR